MSVHAHFGTVVESCSKKVAASSVWASAGFSGGWGGDSANSAAVFFPLSQLRSARKIWQSFPEFLFVLSLQHLTKRAEIYRNSFLSPLHGIILTIFKNAKNGRKKTGNLFRFPVFRLPIMAALI